MTNFIVVSGFNRTLYPCDFLPAKKGVRLFNEQGIFNERYHNLTQSQKIISKKISKTPGDDIRKTVLLNEQSKKNNTLLNNCIALKNKLIGQGMEIQELKEGCYIVVNEQAENEQTEIQDNKNTENLRKVFFQMRYFKSIGIEQYIAAHSLQGVYEPNFISEIFKTLTNGTLSISKENIFDFITGPKNRANDLENKNWNLNWNWIEKYGKNIHIVMAIIDQIEKEQGISSSVDAKFEKARKFVDNLTIDANQCADSKEIKSRLNNVYFFDNSDNNINLAKNIGVNAYLVNNLNDNMTLNVRLSQLAQKIQTIKQDNNSNVMAPQKNSGALFSPQKRPREKGKNESNPNKKRIPSQYFNKTSEVLGESSVSSASLIQ